MSAKIQSSPKASPKSSPKSSPRTAAEELHARIARMHASSQENPHSQMFLFLEEPGSGPFAKLFANLMTVIVVVSIVAFCLETENSLKQSCNYVCWFVIDWLFVAIFSFEFVLRQYLYIKEGRNTEFWKDPLNVIDFIAILPSYIELVQWIALGYPKNGPPEELFLKLMKLAKCTRVFKLMKHFNGTEVLLKTLDTAFEALSIPFFFLGIFVLLFASIMFFIEGQQGELNTEDGNYYNGGEGMTFPNIPATMYFMLVTMTTTGYGDQYPETSIGKLLAMIAAVFGILFLAMPLTIVGNSFYNNWNRFLAKKEAETVRKEMLARRIDFKRRSLMQKDLRRNVEKLVLQTTEPGATSKRLNGTQRDILGSYLTLLHLITSMKNKLKDLLVHAEQRPPGSTVSNVEGEKEKGGRGGGGGGGNGGGGTGGGSKSKTTQVKVEDEDDDAIFQKQLDENRKEDAARAKLKEIKDLMLDMSVNAAVFGSVLGKGTKTKGRKGSIRLLKDVSRRVLVQVKMRKWAR